MSVKHQESTQPYHPKRWANLYYVPVLLQHRGVRPLKAEHQVAEGTVDVLAAALQRRVVGRVAEIHRDGTNLGTKFS